MFSFFQKFVIVFCFVTTQAVASEEVEIGAGPGHIVCERDSSGNEDCAWRLSEVTPVKVVLGPGFTDDYLYGYKGMEVEIGDFRIVYVIWIWKSLREERFDIAVDSNIWMGNKNFGISRIGRARVRSLDLLNEITFTGSSVSLYENSKFLPAIKIAAPR